MNLNTKASIAARQLRLQPTAVTRRMAAALPGLRNVAKEKGLKIHHLGAGYPNPEVTNPDSFVQSTENWFEILARREGLNSTDETPQFLRDAYAYTDTLGPIGPRESFASVYGRDWNIDIDPNRLIPTIGATGGIALLCSLFERANQPLAYITDAPTYAGFLSRATLNSNCQIFSVDMDSEGPYLDQFRDQIRKARAEGFYVPFYYTVPDGHNPAGFSFSQERREAIVEIATEEGILIVEDAPYLYISYLSEGERPQPFISIDPERTVHLFTGSKIGLPGPRVGFIYSDATIEITGGELISLTEMLLTEASADILFHNPLSLLSFQSLLHESDGKVRSSLWPIADQKLKIYSENREIVLGGLECGLGDFPDKISWTNPAAGFFTVVTIRDPHIEVNDQFALHLVEEYGIVIVPMFDFFPDDARQRDRSAGYSQMRLSFGFTESVGEQRTRDLQAAIDQFCTAMRKELSLGN